MYIPTYQDMLDAHERIQPHIRRTPVRTSDYLDDLTGADAFDIRNAAEQAERVAPERARPVGLDRAVRALVS